MRRNANKNVIQTAMIWITVLFLSNGPLWADIPLPTWVAGNGVSYVRYSFETGGTQPAPSDFRNTLDTPYSLIDKVTAASAGWVDPTDPIYGPMITRQNGTGCWEIGLDGFISVRMPVAQASPIPSLFEVVVEVIAINGISALPDIEVADAGADAYYDAIEIEHDALNIGFNWWQQVWTGTVAVASDGSLSVNVVCNSPQASYIDQVAVYARPIPEPMALSFIVLAAVVGLVARRFVGGTQCAMR